MLCGRIIAELKKHTRVYQAADRLGMLELANFCFTEVQRRYIEYAVDHPDYASLLELVYNSTHSTDQGLRFFMTERTLNSPWFDNHERLARIINHHEHMAYRVWKKTKQIDAEREAIRKKERDERKKRREQRRQRGPRQHQQRQRPQRA